MAAVTQQGRHGDVIARLPRGYLIIVATDTSADNIIVIHIRGGYRRKSDRIFMAGLALRIHQYMVRGPTQSRCPIVAAGASA